jgi:hypothetical protein
MPQLLSKRESALRLAAKGFHIFPVTENRKKPPLIKGWQTKATSNPKQVAAVWEYAPKLNIGCLIPNGFSIDFDAKKGGLDSLKRMEDAGLLPRTYTQRSAAGGFHKTYKCSPEIAQALKNGVDNVPGYPGVDIRASTKGYIVGAGSTTDDGVYTIEDDSPIAEAPSTLIDIFPKEAPGPIQKFEAPADGQDSESEKQRAIHFLTNVAEEAIQGRGGDNATIRVINLLRDYNLSDEVAFELLDDYWNASKAIPPWEPADLLKKFRSAKKSRKLAIGAKAPEVEFDAVEPRDLRKDTSAPPPGAWDDPTDLWKEEQLPADMLDGIAPPITVKFGVDRARSFGVNSDAVIAPTIAVLGSLIPATNVLQMLQNRSTWPVLPIFWTGLVADPGSAKSAAASAPLIFAKVLDKKWADEFAKEMRDYERAEMAYSARATKRKGKDAAGDCDEDVLPPQKPKLRSKIANDATTEALASRLADAAEVAPITLHSDELTAWLATMDAYRTKAGKDRAFYLQAKEGGSYRVDRQGRGSILVPNLAISIIGGIQDDVLAKLAPDLATDGLLQRFALVALKQHSLGEDNAEDPSIEAAIPRVALALGSLHKTTYRLDVAADEELRAIKAFKAREMARSDIPSGLKTWLAKTDSEFGRYALAFHLIEWAVIADAVELPPDNLIAQSTARRARRYVEEFLYSHAQYIHSTVLSGSWSDNEVRWVAAYLLTRPDGTEKVTAREIGKSYRRLGNNRKWLFAVMARLEFEGWVRTVDTVRGH